MTDPTSATTSRLDPRLDDSRGMIPLAVVGVILLLSSVLVVGYVVTQDDPEPDIDAQLALAQTEANVQTVIRDSTRRATDRAAAEPLTQPAGTDFGSALNGSDDGLADDPFRNYVRALIYLKVRKNLELAGREDGVVETNVTLPEIATATDFREAIKRVRLDNRETELDVSLSNVTITATYDGAVIEQRETTVDVTVPTPLMQVHDRVSEYQRAIDEAPVYKPGFAQRFNARIYALGWARGWAQNYRAPVAEVLANRHIEPSANAALYRTQQDVFGAADPDLRSAVRLGWACMALKDGAAMFDNYAGDRGLSYDDLSYDEQTNTFAYNDSMQIQVPENSTGGLCSGAHLLHDKLTEGQPSSPGPLDLLGDTDLLGQTETTDIGTLAYLPLAEMMTPDFEYSFQNAVQRIFTIEGAVDAETTVRDDLDIDVTCDTGSPGPVSRDATRTVQTEDRTQLQETDEHYYQYQSSITVQVTARWTCGTGENAHDVSDTDSYSLRVRTVVREEEASPNARIDDINPGTRIASEYKYRPGPPGWGPTAFSNYQGAPAQVTDAILGGISTDSHQQWLDDQLRQTNYGAGPPEEGTFETTDTVELDYERLFGDVALTGVLTDDIIDLQERASAVEIAYERRDLLTGNPVRQLREELNGTLKEERIERDDAYDSVGQKAVYEARYNYYRTLLDRLTDLEDAHNTATGALTDRLSGVDSSLTNVTQFLQQGLREDAQNRPTLASSNLTGPLSYEVSGAPTYLLSTETVDSDRVPAVEQGVDFAPLRAKNRNVIDMPYDDVINGILSTVAEWVPGVSGTPDATITLRMAGDVLSAGDIAIEAHEEGNATGRNDTYLQEPAQFETDLARFENNVEETLETFTTVTAEQTVTGLYPSPVTECLLYDPGDDHHPGRSQCAGEADEQERLRTLVANATSAVESGVRAALDPYDTPKAARLIGHGNMTEYIVENVTRELDEPTFHEYEKFQHGYDESHWPVLVDSAVRPAVTSASALSVEIGTVEQAERLDASMQTALTNATTDLVEGRVETVSEQIGARVGERWLGNTKGTRPRVARVPAGLPLLPIPGQWIATANAWEVEVAGEYARFAVSTNMSTPPDTTGLTYVRENRTVTREIAGNTRTLGSVEEIAFDTQTVLLVVTPPGVGVGDRGGPNPECSETYPHVGPVDPDDERDCSERTVDSVERLSGHPPFEARTTRILRSEYDLSSAGASSPRVVRWIDSSGSVSSSKTRASLSGLRPRSMSSAAIAGGIQS